LQEVNVLMRVQQIAVVADGLAIRISATLQADDTKSMKFSE
jgi:hypothetical protein